MHSDPIDTVLLIHGYSEQSLDAYGGFPTALMQAATAAGKPLDTVILSAFDSLDDGVTIDDLAAGLEKQVSRLEDGAKRPWDTSQVVVISHSTGALAARRWLLNRAAKGQQLPSHFITMAGANHGSTLAQVGRTPLGQAHQYLYKAGRTAGARVLTDLDFGSDFLLRLNCEWLKARAVPDSPMSKVCYFSMGGDQLGPDQSTRLLWASRENGCDNTVRISAANLNYNYLEGNVETGILEPLPTTPVPHLIIAGYSHYGPQNGIMAGAQTPAAPQIQAIIEALNIAYPATSDGPYGALATEWAARNTAWAGAPAVNDRGDPRSTVPGMTNADIHANSTIVFNVKDRVGNAIDDCFIALFDANAPMLDADDDGDKNIAIAAVLRLGGAIESRWPIHNTVQRGSYAFYVNTKRFYAAAGGGADPLHHQVTITAAVPGDCVTFDPVSYQTDPAVVHLVQANQTTYVDIVMHRSTDATYAIYDHSRQGMPAPAWRPFPDNAL